MSSSQKIGVLPSLLLPVEPRNFEEAKDNFIPEQLGAIGGGLLGAAGYAGYHMYVRKHGKKPKLIRMLSSEENANKIGRPSYKGALIASVPAGIAGSYIGSAIGQYRIMNRRMEEGQPMIDDRDIRYGKPALRVNPRGR